MKESDLIKIVRESYEDNGFKTYGEVISAPGAPRCDMFATRDNLSIAFEAKLSFSFKVLEQAEFWLKKANFVYIIVPTVFRKRRQRAFAIRTAMALGIGVIEVGIKSKIIKISGVGKKNIKPKLPILYNEQIDTIASNSDNDYVTPFKLTVAKLHKYMKDKDVVLFNDLINNIDHHYKTNTSAKGALSKLIKEHVIDGYFFSKTKNKIYINKHDI